MSVDFFWTTGDLYDYLPLGNNHSIHKHTSCEVAAQRSKNLSLHTAHCVKECCEFLWSIRWFSVTGLIKAKWNLPPLLQLVQQGHSETPSLLQLLVSSTQPLHELFQKTGFLHAPLDQLFLQIQSSPREKVFIRNQTVKYPKMFKK